MNRQQARDEARSRAQRTGLTYLLTERTAHPAYPGQTVSLVIAEQDKRLWADDERLIQVIGPDWRCECGDLNRSHESFCFRCGAGQPDEADSVARSPKP